MGKVPGTAKPWPIRVNVDIKEKFIKRCAALGVDHNDQIREMIKAFAEDRVRIVKSKQQKKREGIVHARNRD